MRSNKYSAPVGGQQHNPSNKYRDEVSTEKKAEQNPKQEIKSNKMRGKNGNPNAINVTKLFGYTAETTYWKQNKIIEVSEPVVPPSPIKAWFSPTRVPDGASPPYAQSACSTSHTYAPPQ